MTALPSRYSLLHINSTQLYLQLFNKTQVPHISSHANRYEMIAQNLTTRRYNYSSTIGWALYRSCSNNSFHFAMCWLCTAFFTLDRAAGHQTVPIYNSYSYLVKANDWMLCSHSTNIDYSLSVFLCSRSVWSKISYLWRISRGSRVLSLQQLDCRWEIAATLLTEGDSRKRGWQFCKLFASNEWNWKAVKRGERI